MAHADSSGGEQPAGTEEFNITITYRVRTHHPISSTSTSTRAIHATIKDQAQKLSNQVLNATWPDAECMEVDVLWNAAKQPLTVGSTRPLRRDSLQHGSNASNPPPKNGHWKEDSLGDRPNPAPNRDPEHPQAAQDGLQHESGPPKDSNRKEDSSGGRSKDNPAPNIETEYPQIAKIASRHDSDAIDAPWTDSPCRSKDNLGASLGQRLIESTRHGSQHDSNAPDSPSKDSCCKQGSRGGRSKDYPGHTLPKADTQQATPPKRKRPNNDSAAKPKKKRDLKVKDAAPPVAIKKANAEDDLFLLLEKGMAVILDFPETIRITWEDDIERLKPSNQTSQSSQDFELYSKLCHGRGWLAEFMRLCALELETMRDETRMDGTRRRKILYTVFGLINELFVHTHIGARAFHIIVAFAGNVLLAAACSCSLTKSSALETSFGINVFRYIPWENVKKTVQNVAARLSAFPRWDEVPIKCPLDPVDILANDRRKRDFVQSQLGLKAESGTRSERVSSPSSTETGQMPEEANAQANLGRSSWARPPTSQQVQSPETIAGTLGDKEVDYGAQRYSGQNAVADRTNSGQDSNNMDTTSLQDLQVELDWESFIHPGLFGFADLGWNLLHEDISGTLLSA
ncbi:hypothetical protein LTR37_020335 [Vermiconidia calcicola]|uniref:Uncharacterized protein n=1 Tax=Vermiconidia calcicola TaxID=1690605 RepID=A0ACC3MBL5_9PEZI|nr:hypothetical protein LTR37_020335 [Vermiconidia calcicola]